MFLHYIFFKKNQNILKKGLTLLFLYGIMFKDLRKRTKISSIKMRL